MTKKIYERAYTELSFLLIEKLPEYIEKINKNVNDGIILKQFENKKLIKDTIKRPSFKFAFEKTELEEKDRIICNTKFTISIEFILEPGDEDNIFKLSRYQEAIIWMIDDERPDWHYIFTCESIKKIKITLTLPNYIDG